MDADTGMYEKTPKRVFSYMSPWFDFFTASPRDESGREKSLPHAEREDYFAQKTPLRIK